MVSVSLERKRKCDQKIQEPKAKVAKASMSSTKTTVKKVKQNSKGFSILRTGKKEEEEEDCLHFNILV